MTSAESMIDLIRRYGKEKAEQMRANALKVAEELLADPDVDPFLRGCARRYMYRTNPHFRFTTEDTLLNALEKGERL